MHLINVLYIYKCIYFDKNSKHLNSILFIKCICKLKKKSVFLIIEFTKISCYNLSILQTNLIAFDFIKK